MTGRDCVFFRVSMTLARCDALLARLLVSCTQEGSDGRDDRDRS